jgi:hypothetical protein
MHPDGSQTLRAHNDALGGVTACLGQLIAATRPLRAAAAAAARRRAAAAAAAQGPGTHASDVARMSVAFEEAEEWPELRHLTALLTGAAAASPSTADPCEGSTGRAGRAQGGRGGGGAACDSADSLRNDGGGCGGGSSRGGGGGEGGRTGGGGRGGRRAGMQTRRRSTEQAGAALQTGRGAAAASRQHGGGGSGRGDGGAQQHSAGLSSTQGSAPEHATGAAHSGALPPALARGGSCSSDGSGSAGFGAPSWMEHMGLGGEGGAAAALERFEAMGVRAVAKRVRQYVQVGRLGGHTMHDQLARLFSCGRVMVAWPGPRFGASNPPPPPPPPPRRSPQVCSVDLFQLRAGAGAATGPTAHARLQAQMDRLIAFSTALVASNPRVLGEVSVYRLDSCEPYGADGPARSHWAFVLRQARMTRRQVRWGRAGRHRRRGRAPRRRWARRQLRTCAHAGGRPPPRPPARARTQELAMARLLELYHGRLAVFLPRREALLARQADSAADPAAQEEVLAELEHYTCEYTYCAMAFANALYTSILDADQVGGAGRGRGGGAGRGRGGGAGEPPLPLAGARKGGGRCRGARAR